METKPKTDEEIAAWVTERCSEADKPMRERGFESLCALLREEYHCFWDGPLKYNELSNVIEAGNSRLSDVDALILLEKIPQLFKQADRDKKGPIERTLRFSKQDIIDAISRVAHQNKFHPVADHLRSLKWDGTSRLAEVAPKILGSSSPEAAIILVRWFICAVARPLSPGCKVDSMLILVGDQGIGKSRFFSTIASERWFSDALVDVNSRDGTMVASSSWIAEWSELEAMKRAKEMETVKSFLSIQTDRFRAPYERMTTIKPRSFVVVGTTNNWKFLPDHTGHRRFWTVQVPHRVDLGMAKELRDQLLAEAVDLYDKGEQWWLDAEEERAQATLASEHEIIDAWTPDVLAYAARLGSEAAISLPAILEHGIGKPKGQWTRSDEMRVSHILQRLGYHKRHTERGKRWFQPEKN